MTEVENAATGQDVRWRADAAALADRLEPLLLLIAVTGEVPAPAPDLWDRPEVAGWAGVPFEVALLRARAGLRPSDPAPMDVLDLHALAERRETRETRETLETLLRARDTARARAEATR